jgi:hypothetical protein
MGRKPERCQRPILTFFAVLSCPDKLLCQTLSVASWERLMRIFGMKPSEVYWLKRQNANLEKGFCRLRTAKRAVQNQRYLFTQNCQKYFVAPA